jgi:NTP pyrophosphatase (non-canonical NTP hydrolase)
LRKKRIRRTKKSKNGCRCGRAVRLLIADQATRVRFPSPAQVLRKIIYTHALNIKPFFMTGIMDDILKELKRAKKKFPNWPDHPAARAGIVCEEAGELMKACLEFKYELGKGGKGHTDMLKAIRKEAIQTAAVALRFLENL